jgi:hypothetical protein
VSRKVQKYYAKSLMGILLCQCLWGDLAAQPQRTTPADTASCKSLCSKYFNYVQIAQAFEMVPELFWALWKEPVESAEQAMRQKPVCPGGCMDDQGDSGEFDGVFGNVNESNSSSSGTSLESLLTSWAQERFGVLSEEINLPELTSRGAGSPPSAIESIILRSGGIANPQCPYGRLDPLYGSICLSCERTTLNELGTLSACTRAYMKAGSQLEGSQVYQDGLYRQFMKRSYCKDRAFLKSLNEWKSGLTADQAQTLATTLGLIDLFDNALKGKTSLDLEGPAASGLSRGQLNRWWEYFRPYAQTINAGSTPSCK